ncbi:citrate:sodium symporter [Propionigenium maris DSM 9537]|uniref:Citrate:sodium symporter n=1 Tax=Propionigenium maris DSM 9537 TaxID=1123000 RepID=A0A9W6GPB6_9FUSO|nr:2-hydroxycarboxylate transporter family protein [Propionigenium maris]GLI57506.1 citrate:sodium symporter [Propionigenium maris DSM 9537]
MSKTFGELVNFKESKWKGLPTGIFFSMFVAVLLMVYLPDAKGVQGGYIRPNFLSILAITGIFGIFFGEIGDRIPVWNKYVGGGTVLVFFMGAIFGTYDLLPEAVLKSSKVFYNKQPVNFLELFIPALIVGSVLTVNRKTLLKSVSGYVPLILIGVLGATVGGALMGLIFGKTPLDIMMNYVLPIMGGGTGAGAIPMSEMWAAKTGGDPTEWFAFGISILTIANIIAIFTGALLKTLGERKPHLTGNGDLIISGDGEKEEDIDWGSVGANQQDFAAALFMTGVLFMFSHFSGVIWASWNMPFDIHRLAFLVIYVIILNVFDVVPTRLKAGAKNMQSFFSKYTIWVLMAVVGFTTNVNDIINALTVPNLAIATAIVLGATGAIMLVSKFFRFYAVEAAITAGLCMANRGGSGDIAVLGAADRMELISFGQISSRIGGAMMLIIGSIIFGLFA